jgi:hypothetical protein
MEATLLGKGGADFTTEYLGDDVCCQLGARDLKKDPLLFSLRVFGDEAADGTIVGSFTFRREETAWKLFHLSVINDALAASSFFFARLIGATAPGQVLLWMTFGHTTDSFQRNEIRGQGIEGSGSSTRNSIQDSSPLLNRAPGIPGLINPYLSFSMTAAARSGNITS